MEWFVVIGLILLGIFLVVAEIIFIPGIFIAGSVGTLISIYAIYYSYNTFGDVIGTITLAFTVIGNIVGVTLALRGKSWEKVSLKESHTSKVNENLYSTFRIGDKGISISALKPVGKALIGGKEIEVVSYGGYISENIEIEIIKLGHNKIIVTQTNKSKK